jgi:hypothetical protein
MTILRGRSVVAIDPTPRGIAFVFVENGEVMDWGERMRGARDELRIIDSLIDGCAADVLALESADAAGCERRPRIRTLLREIVKHARRRGVRVVTVAREDVRAAWLARGATNKETVAAMIAACYPELSAVVPPRRRPGANEDPRVNIFDAASLVLTNEIEPAELLP